MEKKDLLNRLQILSEKFLAIAPKLNLDEKIIEQTALKKQTEASDFWNNPTEAQKVSQKLSQTEKYQFSLII